MAKLFASLSGYLRIEQFIQANSATGFLGVVLARMQTAFPASTICAIVNLEKRYRPNHSKHPPSDRGMRVGLESQVRSVHPDAPMWPCVLCMEGHDAPH